MPSEQELERAFDFIVTDIARMLRYIFDRRARSGAYLPISTERMV